MRPRRLSWTRWPASRAPGILARAKQMRCGTLLHTASEENDRTAMDLQLNGTHLLRPELACNACNVSEQCQPEADILLSCVQGVRVQWRGPLLPEQCQGGESSYPSCEINQ